MANDIQNEKRKKKIKNKINKNFSMRKISSVYGYIEIKGYSMSWGKHSPLSDLPDVMMLYRELTLMCLYKIEYETVRVVRVYIYT